MDAILIVDDVKANRILLTQMVLKMRDFIIFEAVNGKEAIVQFEQKKPDLILMDINMPEMDGYLSSQAIKEKAGNNYIPIIFITALIETASLDNAIAAGGDDFLSKPFDFNLLESKITAHLRIRALNQQLCKKNKQLSCLNQHLNREQHLIEYFFNRILENNFLEEKFIKYFMKSTSAFSGDILLSERDDVGNLYLVVGDFTGHGLSAAMGTLPVAMIFFKMVKEKATIAEIAREFNKQLYQFMPSEMFFAATLIKLDKQNNTMTVWIGGMPECYWLTQYGELKKVIPSQYLPLGILNDNDFNETPEIYHINKDDKVYLYSDGVIEAQNAEGKMFGSERFKEIVISQQDNLFDQVLNEFKDFTYNVEPKDDITLVELTCYDQIEGFLCK